ASAKTHRKGRKLLESQELRVARHKKVTGREGHRSRYWTSLYRSCSPDSLDSTGDVNRWADEKVLQWEAAVRLKQNAKSAGCRKGRQDWGGAAETRKKM
ncbi:hypothetical protein Csa_006549, partial [Cucumis sativus]